jgi:Highly conserved protein containing a thioredoxin domain
MSDTPVRNRLDTEASPYLTQHAENPVNWQPWDDRALEYAESADKPIFLSVGYAACHWCHVMAEESFEDDTVASILNDSFVPIKVDREERPDLDRIYQTICQLVTGGGGWPLSVWLTPEGKPFYVGTYFPKTERPDRGDTPGFLEICQSFATAWENDRSELESRADQWADALQDRLEADTSGHSDADDVPTPEAESSNSDNGSNTDLLTSVSTAAIRATDNEYGGFGSRGPKFPQPGRTEALLRAHAEIDRETALNAATATLDSMAAGGVYDHIGGGFHRYATDREWTVPHFEKMLYDNAEIPRVYLSAYQHTGRDRYARIAHETFSFLSRELQHPEGGFYSTLDAQSEGKEGRFYVWTPQTVRDAIDDSQAADIAIDRFGVTEGGNFEGSTVLTVTASISQLASKYSSTTDEIVSQLADARDSLFDARTNREHPNRDEKILTAWNGLAISSLARGGLILETDQYTELATDALSFIRTHLWDSDAGRLSRRYKDGDVDETGYLDDYAFLARGVFDLYQTTGNVEHLSFAVTLAETIVRLFYDASGETLYLSPKDAESLVARPQDLRDQSTPSSAGIAVQTLNAVDPFTSTDLSGIAAAVLDTHADEVRGRPLEHISLAMAADSRAREHDEIVIAHDIDTGLSESMRSDIASTYLPGVPISQRPATASALEPWIHELGLDSPPTIWVGRNQRDNTATVYACSGRACSPPTHSLTDALEWFDTDIIDSSSDTDADATDTDTDTDTIQIQIQIQLILMRLKELISVRTPLATGANIATY